MANGSSTFSPSRKAGNGETGAITASTVSNALREIARNQRAHFLRLQIICVIIARAQHISAQHDAALALRAEAFAACVAIHLGQRAGVRGARSVAHAVIARQVRAGFRRGDDVIAGDGVIGRWAG